MQSPRPTYTAAFMSTLSLTLCRSLPTALQKTAPRTVERRRRRFIQVVRGSHIERARNSQWVSLFLSPIPWRGTSGIFCHVLWKTPPHSR
ncbi:hypothetical protein C8R47DRAFT_1127755 [Mycena vitilis]|nr:hypothetical protein C8R47DRAFT_1127755 [Mycena vitilis]